MMLVFVPATTAFLCFSLWVIAEFENSRRLLRMGLGILTTAAVAVLAYGLARFGPNIESHATRSSLQVAEQLLAQGDTRRVLQAVQAYNQTAAAGSTYQASGELWYVLNHGPRTGGDAGSGLPPQ